MVSPLASVNKGASMPISSENLKKLFKTLKKLLKDY